MLVMLVNIKSNLSTYQKGAELKEYVKNVLKKSIIDKYI